MSLESLIEFTAPDFSTNCKTNALYRRSAKTVQLKTKDNVFIIVPQRLEIVNNYNNWQQHPVLFARYPDPDAYARIEGEFIIFLSDGSYTSVPFSRETIDVELYKQARRYSLTDGNIKISR